MKNLSVAAVLIWAVAFFGGIVWGQESTEAPAAPRTAPAPIPKPEYHRSGTLNVVRDGSGNVKEVKLIIWTYDLVLEEQAKDLINLDGKRVRVFGSFVEKDGKRCISVKRFESLEPAETKIEATTKTEATPTPPQN